MGPWSYIERKVVDQPVSSKSECESICTNDESCKFYEFYPFEGILYCNTYIYATGVTSISSTILNSIFEIGGPSINGIESFILAVKK